MRAFKFLIPVTLAITLAGCFGSKPERPDLGAVLDRTLGSLKAFQDYLTKQKVTEVKEEEWKKLSLFMTDVMNREPKFYSKPLGIMLLKDAKFEGYEDKNNNKIKDTGESRVFTVEIDAERKRLIATDEGGSSVGSGMARAGTGFIAGMVLGSLLGRQRGAGIRPSSFANRKVQSRQNYGAARSRARSGGIRRGK